MQVVRKKILEVLKNPTSVSDLKNKIPEVSSFGTIAYHLKQLENEGLIKKKKISDERGKPTYYFLKNVKKIPSTKKEIEKLYEKLILGGMIKTLELLKKKPREDDFFIKYNDGELADSIMDCNIKGLSKISHTLTEEGEAFLKKHSIKHGGKTK